MSELNKIVTNFPMSLSQEENRNLALTLSAVLEGGGGGVANAIWKPAVDQDGELTWSWDTYPDSARPPEAVNIKGPRGESGAPGRDGTNGTNGTNGADGKTPQIQINSSNAHWEWRYSGASEWTDLGVVASGAVGPQGIPGVSGASGAPGAKGADGEDGFSPAVTLSAITDPQHPNGGTRVTITDKEHPAGQNFDIFNGDDGSGSSDEFDSTTISGYGTAAAPYGVDTTVIATKTWTSTELDKKLDPSDLTPAHGVSGAWDSGDQEYNFGLWNDYEQAIQTVSARVMIPDSADVSLKDKYLVLRTKADGTVDGWTDFQNQSYSKTEADGRYMRKETDATLDGIGTSADKLRISDSVMDQIGSKSTITSAAGNVFTVSGGAGTEPNKNFVYSGVNYKSGQTAGYVPQQLFVVASDNEIVSLVNGGAADGKGSLFFRVQ